jgi:diguanylate cyclase (GGDEF)-like protein
MISMSRHLERDDVFDHEYRVRDDTGNFVWIQERAIATKSGNGKPNRLTGIIRNVDARKKSEEEVTFLSNHDALTGQYNKLRLRESLEHVIAQSLLTQQPGGLLLVGIDKLNALSDVYGEESADTIVLAAARRIETSMRSGDVVGRVGYDRFAVIVENCSRSKLTIVAERFLSAIRDNPIATPAGAMTITASVGISVFPGDASTARDVVSHADNALRAARRLGCDCYLDYINVPEHARTERPELVIAEQVKQALKEDRFKLAFQPVVSARTGDVAFYEGLAENPGRSSAQSARSGFAAHSGDHRDRGPGRCR